MLRSRSILACLFSALLLINSSCKKKENTPTPVSGTASPDPNNYYGSLTTESFALWQGGVLSPEGISSDASFSSAPLVSGGNVAGTMLDAGNVSLNGVYLKKGVPLALPFNYVDTTYMAAASGSRHWLVTGAGNVPVINYTCNDPYPTYTGYALLPDTIHLGQSNTISLQGIGGADEIEVVIFTSAFTDKTIPGNSTSVTFSAADLSTLSPANNAFVSMISYKNSYQLFGGKTYKFSTAYGVQKNIIVN